MVKKINIHSTCASSRRKTAFQGTKDLNVASREYFLVHTHGSSEGKMLTDAGLRLMISKLSLLQSATMSKPIVPSRNLLLSFSRCLNYERSLPSSVGCQRLTTFAASPLPRRTPTSCLRAANGVGKKDFSTSASRPYKTVQEQRSRYRSGVRLTELLSHSKPKN